MTHLSLSNSWCVFSQNCSRQQYAETHYCETPNPPGTLKSRAFACGCGDLAQQWYLPSAPSIEQPTEGALHSVACTITSFGTFMCLCPQCRRGTHWQQHHRFVGVLAEESEMKVCLPRLRWQLARGRNASGLRYVRVEQSGEFACFARIVSITAQEVRRA